MKKIIYKYIALFIAISSIFIEKTFSAGGASQPRIGINNPENKLLLLKFFFIPIVAFLIILNLFIFPYKFHKNYKKLNDEEKLKINRFIKYEKFIFYGLFYGLLILFLITLIILEGEIPIDIELFICNYSIKLLIIHYIINLIYGIYLYRKKDKVFAKKYLRNIHIFTIIFSVIIYIIFVFIIDQFFINTTQDGF